MRVFEGWSVSDCRRAIVPDPLELAGATSHPNKATCRQDNTPGPEKPPGCATANPTPVLSPQDPKPDFREILHVLGDKKAAGIKHQHTQICVAVNLFRAVRAEHSSPDDDRIKSDAS